MPSVNAQQFAVGDKGEFNRSAIEFNADGSLIRGWLYVPKENVKKCPAIVMAHGFGSLKEMHLDEFAEVFVKSGFAVIVFDYRGFGDSEGSPRNEVDPYKQIEDYRHAITFATTVDEIDEQRIGIWGTSYSGGHVLVVAATDYRVKCVVSQVPTVSGNQSSLRRVPPERIHALHEAFAEDRINRMNGEEPTMRTLVSYNSEDRPVYGLDQAVKWYSEAGERSPNWTNQVTLRSVEFSRSYNPGAYISYIAPVPLLMILGKEDYVTPTDLALQAYSSALEPKKLTLLEGGHFDPYVKYFSTSSTEATQWFMKHLDINTEEAIS